jgi:hypothetical protein
MGTKFVRILASLEGFPKEQHIFVFSLIIEGTTEKVLQLIMPVKSIYNRNFGFIEQKNVFLNNTESF